MKKGLGKTIVGAIDREVLEFTEGKDPVLDLKLAEVDCIGSAAHVTMLTGLPGRSRVFTAEQAKRVVRELVSILGRIRAGRFTITPEDQDVHLAIERMLTDRLGDLGRKVHTARSRNDQVALDLRLWARAQMQDALSEVISLANVLLEFGARHADLPMVGRTHLQPAMPTSVGMWAEAHAEGLLDDLGLLQAAYRFNNRNPLGSAAGYGVPFPLDRRKTTQLLAFDSAHASVICAGNSRGKCEYVVASAMGQIMVTLSRMAEDIVLFTMPEFGYFRLPAAYCTGSSIMPQKNNPDVLELVRGRTGKVLGCCSQIGGVVARLPSGYSRDLQECKEPFIEAVETTRACLRILAPLISRMEADRGALLRGFSPDVFATDFALELVSKGMPFRLAYNHVKEHREELAGFRADAALAVRRSLKGCRTDLQGLRGALKRADRLVGRERARCNTAIGALLGVAYPSLARR